MISLKVMSSASSHSKYIVRVPLYFMNFMNLSLTPTQWKRTAGRPTKRYVDQLQADTGYTIGEIESCMENRNLWRAIIGVRQMTPEGRRGHLQI